MPAAGLVLTEPYLKALEAPMAVPVTRRGAGRARRPHKRPSGMKWGRLGKWQIKQTPRLLNKPSRLGQMTNDGIVSA